MQTRKVERPGLNHLTRSAGCGGGATEESAGSPEPPASSAPATSAPATPTPEETPSEEATPTPSEVPMFYQNFGTFEPVKGSGEGDSVVSVFGDDGGPPAVAVTASHTGESNFVIKSQGDESYLTDVLVNTVGDYQGTTGSARQSLAPRLARDSSEAGLHTWKPASDLL
jgi:hypothetical protein